MAFQEDSIVIAGCARLGTCGGGGVGASIKTEATYA